MEVSLNQKTPEKQNSIYKIFNKGTQSNSSSDHKIPCRQKNNSIFFLLQHKSKENPSILQDKVFEEIQSPPCHYRYVQNIRMMRINNIYAKFYMGLTIVYCLSITLRTKQQQDQINQITGIIEKVCQSLFIICALIRLASLEPISLGWCACEFTALVTGTAAIIVENEESLKYLRTLRCLRILLLVRIIPYFYQSFSHFTKGFKNVTRILVPIFVITFLYSIFGLHLFSGIQYNRCRDVNNINKPANWTYQADLDYLCGERQCPKINQIQLQCLNPLNYNVLPNSDELNTYTMGYGLFNYGNIFLSFFNTWKMLYLTGWSRTPILIKQGLFQILVIAYYLSFIYLVAYVYMNIFYGMIIFNKQQDIQRRQIQYFDKNDQEQEEKNQEKAQKEHFLDQNEIDYLNQEQVIAIIKKAKKSKKVSVFMGQEVQKISLHENKSFKYNKENQNKTIFLQKDYYLPDNLKTKKTLTNLAKVYSYFNNVMIILACINLSIYFEEEDKVWRTLRGHFDLFFLIQFILHVWGHALFYFIKESILEQWCKQNKIDFLHNLNKISINFQIQVILLIISLTGISRQLFDSDDLENIITPQISWSRVARTVKYCRIFILITDQDYFKDLKIIFQLLKKIFKKMLSFLGLYLIMLLFFAIVGFNLFSKTSQYAQVSFSSVYESLIFVSLNFYNQQWDSFMLQNYQKSGNSILVFQLLCVTIGAMIISKYMMALVTTQLVLHLESKQIIQNHNIPTNSSCQHKSFNAVNQSISEKQKQRQRQRTKSNFDIVAEDYEKSINDDDVRNKKTDITQKPQTNNEQNMLKQTKMSAISPQEQTLSQPTVAHRIKEKIKAIIQHNLYVAIYLCFIIVQIIELAQRKPLECYLSPLHELLNTIEKIMTIVFAIEMIIQIFAYGVYKNQNSYFKRAYTHFLNAIIICVTLTCLIPIICDHSIVIKLRKIKILRLIIFVEYLCFKNNKMKLTIISFTRLLPKLTKFLFILFVFYSFFAIILMELYAGHFWACKNYPSQISISTRNECLSWGGDWVQNSMNADNMINSLLLVFMVASTEGWSQIMFSSANISGANLQPVVHQNQQIRVFFIVFFFVGNIIILNAFMGLAVYTIKKIQKQETGQSNLTKSQEQWLLMKDKINRLKLEKIIEFPKKSIRYICQQISNSFIFKATRFISALTYLIMCSLTTSSNNIIDKSTFIERQYIFIGIQLIILGIIALGWNRKIHWVKWISHTVSFTYALIFGVIYFAHRQLLTDDTILLCGAIFLLFQLYRYWLSLKQIPYAARTLNFLKIIVPRGIYTLIPMFVVLLIYALIGLQLFSYLRPNYQINSYDQNYQSLSKSIFSLLKFSTWEAPIGQIVNAAQSLQPSFICVQINNFQEYQEYGLNGCGSKLKSYLFFITFHIMYSMVFLSSLTAHIFDSYCQVQRQEEISQRELQLDKVCQQWLQLDKEGTGFLNYRNFWLFASRLQKIYGVSKQKIISDNNNMIKQKFLTKMAIPMYYHEGNLSFEFYETIESLTHIMLMKKYSTFIQKENAKNIYMKINGVEQSVYQKSEFTSKHVLTLIICKKGLKNWKKKAIFGFSPSYFCHKSQSKYQNFELKQSSQEQL